MNRLLLISLIAVSGVVLADDQVLGPKTTKCWTYSKHMDEKRTKLPALFDICAKLGIDKAKCAENTPFVLNGNTQTDKALWYTGTESSPDDYYSSHCYGAVPIEHYYTWDGTRGTTYACLAAPEDDEVTAAELSAITRYAERLNSIGKKSLSDHQSAVYIKTFAKSLAGAP